MSGHAKTKKDLVKTYIFFVKCGDDMDVSTKKSSITIQRGEQLKSDILVRSVMRAVEKSRIDLTCEMSLTKLVD